MANNYYNATGVLILDRVTPVITALFGGFNLNPSFPGDGKAYIAEIAETNDPVWEEVQEYLMSLADDLGVPLPVDEYPSVAKVLKALASHFRVDHHAELANLIKHHDFTGYADLEVLFLIATCFDDGHNLTAIAFEGSWHGEKPSLFEFGGNSDFISRPFSLSANTSRFREMSINLHAALIEDDLDAAAVVIVNETIRLLASVRDSVTRATLRKLVAGHLLQRPSSTA